MPFPASPRVRFARNPLAEVVCQVKFPPVLRVDTEPPAAFQERIRRLFPEYRSSRPQLPLGMALPEDVVQMVFGGGAAVAHEFVAANGLARVSLTRDFVALSVQDYTTWEAFAEILAPALSALVAVYAPPYLTRVGLRYRNQIDRAALGLEAVSWNELLVPAVAGELAAPEVAAHVKRVATELGIRMPDGAGHVRVVHGLDGDAGGVRYVIDADFYTEGQLPPGGINDVLVSFNRRAGHLFRWCLLPRLHAALEPTPA